MIRVKKVAAKPAPAPPPTNGAPNSSVPQYRVAKFSDEFNVFTQPQRAVTSNSFETEDEFQSFYAGGPRDNGTLQPPYDLRTLARLVQENNALGPCIEAMVTNVDGTGFEFKKDTRDDSQDAQTAEDKAQIDKIWDFFLQPWPGESFLTQRKALSRDKHSIGNAYLELIENMNDQIVFSKVIDGKTMRIMRLTEGVPTRIKMKRGGVEVSITKMERYRRFTQIMNGVEVRYFKEFGCPLDLDKYTGKFAPPGARIPGLRRATSVIHFKDLPDANTPYGVPRWIGQLPSVLGSRKAEEFNLEFFDNGGIPPVLIMLQGGALMPQTRDALEKRMSGRAGKNNRVIVIEMEPNTGTIDGSGPQSKATVERFGSEKQNDSMFEKYDERCEIRVRRAFRLPPIFVGQAADYSFATAYASYTYGENNVFKPERDLFDEVMSVKLLPRMGYDGFRMKSNPMKIDDATLKLQGIELAQLTGQVDANEIIDAVNEAVGIDVKISDTLPPKYEQEWHLQVNAGKTTQPSPPKRTAGPTRNGGNGGVQSNSERPKPKPVPVRSPAVSKEDIARVIEGDFEIIEDLPTAEAAE